MSNTQLAQTTSIIQLEKAGTYKCKFGECPKLTHYNYEEWSTNMENFLEAKNYLPIALGSEARPNTANNLRDYNLRAAAAKAMIVSSCSKSVFPYIRNMTDPAIIWTTLKEKCDSTTSLAGRNSLVMNFYNTSTIDTEPISTFCTKLLNIQTQLSGTDQAISNEAFLSYLSSKVPETFRPIIRQYIHQNLYTVPIIIQAIIEEDRDIRNRQGTVSSSNTASTSGTALTARERGQQRRTHFKGKGNGYRTAPYHQKRKSNPNLSCFYCGNQGHIQRDCRIKQRGENIRKVFNDRKRSEKSDDHEADVNFAPATALMANGRVVQGSGRSTDWILDSGASHHIARHRRDFRTLKRLPKPIRITFGNNDFLTAFEKGVIDFIIDGKHLSIEALLVPNIHTSLLSTAQLADLYRISFYKDSCVIQCSDQTYMVIGIKKSDSLFHFRGSTLPTQSTLSYAMIARYKALKMVKLSCWHQRLGHIYLERVKRLLSLYRLDFETEEQSMPAICATCIKAKHQRTYIRKPARRAERPFELIHSDLCGPIQVPSLSDARYFIIYVDDHTRHVWVYFLKSKKAEEVTFRFQEFKTQMKRQFPQWPIVRFRCDNGKGEYDNSLFRGILTVSGITFEPAPPYTQHKNGVAERMIRTLATIARCMMIDSNMPSNLWAEAVNTATYLHARLPSRSLGSASPHEKLYSKRAPIEHLRRFGSVAYKLIPTAQRVQTKFGPRSKLYAFIGYVHNTTKIWKLYDPVSKNVVHASDVVFDETITAFHSNQPDNADILKDLGDDVILDEEEEEESTEMQDVEQNVGCSKHSSATGIQETQDVSNSPSVEKQDTNVMNQRITRSSTKKDGTAMEGAHGFITGYVAEANSRESVGSVENSGFITGCNAEDTSRESASSVEKLEAVNPTHGVPPIYIGEEPRVYHEAVRSESWKYAMREEYSSLQKNSTWQLCTRKTMQTAGVKCPVGCKWVYKLKTKLDQSLRYKARLVIKGYEHNSYHDTFAPVTKLATLRMLIAIACSKGWEIDQMDVTTAFLNPSINEEVYMELPEGYDWLWGSPEAGGNKISHTTHVLKLNKALYGLKTAPRLWYNDIDAYLKTLGFIQSGADPNLYLRIDCVLLLYVDDILLASIDGATRIKQSLKSKYEMVDLGPAQQYLGIVIEKNALGIKIHQAPYISILLERFGLENCNKVGTPLDKGSIRDIQNSASTTAPPHLQRQFQCLLGSIMYAMLATRPDLCFAISILNKHSASPTERHLAAAKRVLRYLKGTKDMGIQYERKPTEPIGYSDSDWAGDHHDRRSTGGFAFLLSSAAISWKAKRQQSVALSSLEAEYMASSEAAKEAIWIRRLYNDITGKIANTPITIHLDNLGCIQSIENPRFHERTKHIDIRYHFVRNAIAEQRILVEHIPSSENTADIMTKALSNDLHRKHVLGLGLRG